MRFATSASIAIMLSGCAASAEVRAYNIASSSKLVVDIAADSWSDYVDGKIDECRGKGLTTKEDRADCLGPANGANEVAAAFTAVRAAQIIVYMSLASGKDMSTIHKSISDLIDSWTVVESHLKSAGINPKEIGR